MPKFITLRKNNGEYVAVNLDRIKLLSTRNNGIAAPPGNCFVKLDDETYFIVDQNVDTIVNRIKEL